MNTITALKVAQHYVLYPNNRTGAFKDAIIYRARNGQFLTGEHKEGRKEWTFEEFLKEYGHRL